MKIVSRKINYLKERHIELLKPIEDRKLGCIKELGKKNFEDIYQYIKQKLNKVEELNEQDYEDIEEFIYKRFKFNQNPMVS